MSKRSFLSASLRSHSRKESSAAPRSKTNKKSSSSSRSTATSQNPKGSGELEKQIVELLYLLARDGLPVSGIDLYGLSKTQRFTRTVQEILHNWNRQQLLNLYSLLATMMGQDPKIDATSLSEEA
jgi:hypothetical protein